VTTPQNRYDYAGFHCWQHEMKTKTLEEDVKNFGLSQFEIESLSPKDFSLSFVDKDEKEKCQEIKTFIERYEWLGKLPVWVTHRFAFHWNDILIGALILSTPNKFSNLLGEEHKDKEKLISRGATISFAPKNTASWMIMGSINWMVHNTPFRIFTAYSDPDAKELGTVYQASNFYYLGQTYGGGYIYFDPENEKAGWVGSSYFSQRGTIKRISSEAGIIWKKDWIKKNRTEIKRKINWEAIPKDAVIEIKRIVKERKAACITKKAKPKHKYVYVLGQTKKETKKLRKLLGEKRFLYPKERGT